MRHGSLFSGIGGFDLAAEWMGWENVFHCEWNEFGQKVLKYYWPKAISYADITQTDFTIHRGGIDILTGGFPCQPYSQAGKRLGKEDHRHLWPEMLRAIREIQPQYVVGENVRGLVNWNGGLVFDEVQANLETEGYEVLPFLLPACAVNAPHRRDRIWFVAYSNNSGNTTPKGGANRNRKKENKRREEQPQSKSSGHGKTTPNTNSDGQHRGDSKHEKQSNKRGVDAQHDTKQAATPNTKRKRLQCSGGSGELGRERFSITDPQSNEPAWQNFPTQSPVCSGNDGLSSQLDGITFPKWRNESIKAYGNAIVPQVALEIFKAIGML